ncbi:flagellar export protein FliJ [Zavarzinia sp. CC-PAN008]|uniref:flagellar export protein FliJ n=1 Tax=Zavarzinia sp. CC-PAN008 TaxID=3243332 RepID=UPI003F748E73
MKGLATLIRLHQRKLDEQRRKLGELDRMRDEMAAKADALEAEVLQEQALARSQPDLMAVYPAYSRQAIARRETLARSLDELDARIAVARDEVADAFQEFKRYELAAEHQARRQRELAAKRAQAELDEIGLQRFRRAEDEPEPT